MVRLVTLLAALAVCAQAHGLDEYLQAALISLEPDSVSVELNLTPGVAVFGSVFALIDLDGDGTISSAEQRAYANRVLGDVSLILDGRPQVLTLSGIQVPPAEQMRAGFGTIRLVLGARFESLPRGPHEVHFENHHRPEIGAFLANALVPPESIAIARQSRDDRQTEISIGYSVRSSGPAPSAGAQILFAAVLCAAGARSLLVKLRRR